MKSLTDTMFRARMMMEDDLEMTAKIAMMMIAAFFATQTVFAGCATHFGDGVLVSIGAVVRGGVAIVFLAAVLTVVAVLFWTEFTKDTRHAMTHDVEVNSNRTNSALLWHALSDEQMHMLGFQKTDWPRSGGECWHYVSDVTPSVSELADDDSITLNVWLPINDGEIEVMTIDEAFLQPYDYQLMLERDPSHSYALQVRENVEDEIARLQSAGVLSGHSRYDYL